MTTSYSSQPVSDFWNPVFPAPNPAQDSELLRQLDFLPGLKEIIMLRQVHALEHATVWVLSGLRPGSGRDISETMPEPEMLTGLSTDQGFYLYGQVSPVELRRAVSIALRRITQGEWDLAVHPRCGTNVSVGMMLTVGLALGIHLLLPRGPIEQLLGLGVAATTAAQLAPDVGSMAQRYLTTAIPFNLAIDKIMAVPDPSGRPTHFIRVRWIEN